MTYTDVNNILTNGITDQQLIYSIRNILIKCELDNMKPAKALEYTIIEITKECQNRILNKL